MNKIPIVQPQCFDVMLKDPTVVVHRPDRRQDDVETVGVESMTFVAS